MKLWRIVLVLVENVSREKILLGSDKKLLCEIFAQENLTNCSDEELVLEAVRRGLMESTGEPDQYRKTEIGKKVRLK